VAEEVDLEQASPLVDRKGLERYVDADASVSAGERFAMDSIHRH
jgi:hypothetical protein